MSETCDVCGFEIESARNPNLLESVGGETYHFCCPLCKSTFNTIKDQYVKKSEVSIG